MKKIFCSIFILFSLMLLTTSVSAAPSENGYIKIDETYVYGGAQTDEIPGISYDLAANTLTISSCEVSNIDISNMGEDFKINVIGKNEIQSIECDSTDVVFTGTGKINMSNDASHDFIFVLGNCVIENVEINFNAENGTDYGTVIYVEGDLTLNLADLSFVEIDEAIYSDGNIKIIESNIVGDKVQSGILGINVDITSSKLIFNELMGSAIGFENELNIKNSKVELKGDAELISSNGGNVSIVDSDIILNDDMDSEWSYGIYTEGVVSIENSNISIDGLYNGIVCREYVMESGKLDIKNVSIGIGGLSKLVFNGGETSIDSAMGAVLCVGGTEEIGIKLGENMITEPNYSIYKAYEEDEQMYLCSFGTGELEFDMQNIEIKNIAKQIVIKEKVGNYSFISGENQTYAKGKDDTLIFEIDAPYSKFEGVYINNELVPQTEYSVKEGSTIVELSKNYLSKLNNGTYNITFKFTDGDVTTSFKVMESEMDDTPQTGTITYISYIMYLLVLSFVGIRLVKINKKINEKGAVKKVQ